MINVNKSDLEMAFDWVSASEYENDAFFCLQTGQIYYCSDSENLFDLDQEIPNDIEDEEKYLGVPSKRDCYLGSSLVFEFASTQLPEHYDRVRDIFRRKGAYRRLKEFLQNIQKLDAWYDYSNAAEAKALAEWCEEIGLKMVAPALD